MRASWLMAEGADGVERLRGGRLHSVLGKDYNAGQGLGREGHPPGSATAGGGPPVVVVQRGAWGAVCGRRRRGDKHEQRDAYESGDSADLQGPGDRAVVD